MKLQNVMQLAHLLSRTIGTQSVTESDSSISEKL